MTLPPLLEEEELVVLVVAGCNARIAAMVYSSAVV